MSVQKPRTAPPLPVVPAGPLPRQSDGAELRQRFADLLRQRKAAGAEASHAQPVTSHAGAEAHPGLPEDVDGSGAPLQSDLAVRTAPAQPRPRPPAPPIGADDSAAQTERAPPRASVSEAGLSPADRQALARLSRTIASFCNDRSVADSDGWQVRIPLRADVLPASVLDLSISPGQLGLRFEIGDADARQLVADHSDELVRQLSQALVRPREITVAVQ